MEKIKTLLIADRGEIAVRIIRTARDLSIRTIAIHTASDASSHHVRDADEAVLLPGPDDATAYADIEAILYIAQDRRADAIIPGYGVLSESAVFARAVAAAGIAWVGPSAENIAIFGAKHVARALAQRAGLPIVPGSEGLVGDVDAAVKVAREVGFPVVLKATAGSDGLGMQVAEDEEDVRSGFEAVTETAERLFKDKGLFVEKYLTKARHIEIQVFGNGLGDVVHFGERECSIQRRNQMVVEECPSPFVMRYEGLRDALGDAAVDLAKSVKYGSVGTIEYILDETTGGVYFLEMSTRLQVEHGITEMCYGIDLVELMLKQADAELAGKGGLGAGFMKSVKEEHPAPIGSAIEARVYAENPVRNYAPSPGVLQEVDWAGTGDKSVRIDTWIETGSTISPDCDLLIAKVIYHSPHSRGDAIDGMQLLLSGSHIGGPPTNLDLLRAIVANPDFAAGRTLTSFLGFFGLQPPAIDVLSPGAHTLVVNCLERQTLDKGRPTPGVVDPIAFHIANSLVGNPKGTEGLEVSFNGPELHFIRPAVVALCGAAYTMKLDGENVPMWSRLNIKAGQKLKIGTVTGGGCRSYLAVRGGFTNIASSSPIVVDSGGSRTRLLAAADLLSIVEEIADEMSKESILPKSLIPDYRDEWEVLAIFGSHNVALHKSEELDLVFTTKWEVSDSSSRGIVRLVGLACGDEGQEASQHSDVVEAGRIAGIIYWNGDGPCMFSNSGPTLGGISALTTIAEADVSKVGQMKVGDLVSFRQISVQEAVEARKLVDHFLDEVDAAIKLGGRFDKIKPLHTVTPNKQKATQEKPNGLAEQEAASLGQ